MALFDGAKRWVIMRLPGAVIRFLAKPYIAGYSVGAAMKTAHKLDRKRNVRSIIDILGENVTAQKDVNRNIKNFKKLIDKMSREFPEEQRPVFAIKLSMFAVSKRANGKLTVNKKTLLSNVLQIAAYTTKHKVPLTIDMEESEWVDTTLDIYEHLLKKKFYKVGVVLQSRLFRTDKDLARFKNYKNARFRLCIGIYRESPEIALQHKPEMKKKLLELIKIALKRGHFVKIATHDKKVVKKALEHIKKNNIQPTQFEFQMLLGVPRKRIQKKIVGGKLCKYGKPITMRLYVPYAETPEDATAYCRRRLLANPDIVTYGAQNLIFNLFSK